MAPCYNEQDALPEFLRRVCAVLDGLGGASEIVLVDDGSRDRTWDVLAEAAGRDPRIVAVRLMRNHGHQLALTAGLSVCRGERILIIDADLQDPPELLPEMMALMDGADGKGGADVVYGQRRARDGESLFKRATAATSASFPDVSSTCCSQCPSVTASFAAWWRGSAVARSR